MRDGETAEVETNRKSRDKGKTKENGRTTGEKERQPYARTYKKNENASTMINCARVALERLIIIG